MRRNSLLERDEIPPFDEEVVRLNSERRADRAIREIHGELHDDVDRKIDRRRLRDRDGRATRGINDDRTRLPWHRIALLGRVKHLKGADRVVSSAVGERADGGERGMDIHERDGPKKRTSGGCPEACDTADKTLLGHLSPEP